MGKRETGATFGRKGLGGGMGAPSGRCEAERGGGDAALEGERPGKRQSSC